MTGVAPTPSWSSAALADLEALAVRLGCRLRRDEPLARHTSMGVGGRCPAMVWPTRPDHVRSIVAWMGSRALPWRVIGGGSNLLVSDAGVADAVLHTGELVEGERFDQEGVRLPAGVPTARALRRTAQRGFDGLIWAAGLPGSVGGAAAGNAGCWGSDMAASVRSLELVDASGASHALEDSELRWSYRDLRLPSRIAAPWLITAVEIRLRPGDPLKLQERYLELQEQKRSRQPVGARNSGCVFRNPEGERTAGQLLDAAGCKGLRVGQVEVSEVHANFLVNRGAGRADEVMELVARVQQRVHDRFGVRLEPEIRRW